MKLTRIIFVSNGLPIVELSFRDPGSTKQFIAKQIVGIDADAVSPKFAGLSLSQQKHYTMTPEKKDLVFSILLNPDFGAGDTFSSLRDKLYKAIAASRTPQISIQFLNGTELVASLSGFITKLENDQFEKTPIVNVTVRIDDPILRGTEEDIDTEEFGSTSILFDDIKSSMFHGFGFQAVIDDADPMALFKIEDTISPDWTFQVNYVFEDGDEIYFSSVDTDRHFYIIRGITTIHLIDTLISGAVWPIFFPGPNDLTITSPAFTFIRMWHTPAYWGV